MNKLQFHIITFDLKPFRLSLKLFHYLQSSNLLEGFSFKLGGLLISVMKIFRFTSNSKYLLGEFWELIYFVCIELSKTILHRKDYKSFTFKPICKPNHPAYISASVTTQQEKQFSPIFQFLLALFLGLASFITRQMSADRCSRRNYHFGAWTRIRWSLVVGWRTHRYVNII